MSAGGSRGGGEPPLAASGCRRLHHGTAFSTEPSTTHGSSRRRLARAASTPAALRRRLPCAPPHHGALRRRLPRTGSPTVLCAAGFIEHGAASCSTAGAACASCYSGFNSRWMSAAGAGWAQLGLHEATAVRICCVSWWVLCVWGGGVVFTLCTPVNGNATYAHVAHALYSTESDNLIISVRSLLHAPPSFGVAKLRGGYHIMRYQTSSKSALRKTATSITYLLLTKVREARLWQS